MTDYMQQVVADSEELTIVGVVQPKADATSAILHSGLDYLHELTYHVIDQAAEQRHRAPAAGRPGHQRADRRAL